MPDCHRPTPFGPASSEARLPVPQDVFYSRWPEMVPLQSTVAIAPDWLMLPCPLTDPVTPTPPFDVWAKWKVSLPLALPPATGTACVMTALPLPSIGAEPVPPVKVRTPLVTVAGADEFRGTLMGTL